MVFGWVARARGRVTLTGVPWVSMGPSRGAGPDCRGEGCQEARVHDRRLRRPGRTVADRHAHDRQMFVARVGHAAPLVLRTHGARLDWTPTDADVGPWLMDDDPSRHPLGLGCAE